jgi:hypothetical protein
MATVAEISTEGMLSTCLFAAMTIAVGPTASVLIGAYEGVHLPSVNQNVLLGILYTQDTGGQNWFRISQPLTTTWGDTRPTKEYLDTCSEHRIPALT